MFVITPSSVPLYNCSFSISISELFGFFSLFIFRPFPIIYSAIPAYSSHHNMNSLFFSLFFILYTVPLQITIIKKPASLFLNSASNALRQTNPIHNIIPTVKCPQILTAEVILHSLITDSQRRTHGCGNQISFLQESRFRTLLPAPKTAAYFRILHTVRKFNRTIKSAAYKSAPICMQICLGAVLQMQILL